MGLELVFLPALFFAGLHTNYQVWDSCLNSLFGPGGVEEWRGKASSAPRFGGCQPVLC